MRIVKPTKPESMAVLVDTIFWGEKLVTVAPSEVAADRIDIVVARVEGGNVRLGTITGPPVNTDDSAWLWPDPTLPEGAKALAEIRVHRCQTAIYDSNIVEI